MDKKTKIISFDLQSSDKKDSGIAATSGMTPRVLPDLY
jgi:hypothetical protein